MSKYRLEIKGLKIVPSPAQPFAIHIRSFSSNVRFKGSLQYRRPVQVTFVIGYIITPVIRICMRVGSSPCSPFATRKFRSQVRPIPGRIEWLPPLTRVSTRVIIETEISSPEVMKVVRECSSEEPFESSDLWSSTMNFRSIKEVSKSTWIVSDKRSQSHPQRHTYPAKKGYAGRSTW